MEGSMNVLLRMFTWRTESPPKQPARKPEPDHKKCLARIIARWRDVEHEQALAEDRRRRRKGVIWK